jgi:hypothetical protein
VLLTVLYTDRLEAVAVLLTALHRNQLKISDGRGYELEPTGHADDGHASADEGEQVAGHSSASSVDNSSDGNSVNCPVCSVTFTKTLVTTHSVLPACKNDQRMKIIAQFILHTCSTPPWERNYENPCGTIMTAKQVQS